MRKRCFNCDCHFSAVRSDQLFCSPRCRYNYHHKGDLVLTLKKQWFEMILSGIKTEEYREIKPYWEKRFMKYFGQHYDTSAENPSFVWNNQRKDIVFRNGYGNDKPQFSAECTISEGYGKVEWGAEKGKKYYILKIHRVFGVKNIVS